MIGLGLGLSLGSRGAVLAPSPELPTTDLLLDYDIANAAVVAGGVNALTPTGSKASDANTALAYQWSRPTYTAEDADFGGKASASVINAAAALVSGVFAAPIAQPSTWYLVARLYEGANAIYWRLKANGSLAGSAGLYSFGSGITLRATSNTNEITAAVAAGVHMIAVVYNGASSAIYVDDMSTAAATGNGSSSACESLYTGTYNGEYADASYKWARHLAYGAAHDETARQAVADYLVAEYGL